MSKTGKNYVNDKEWCEKVAKDGLEKHRKAGNVVTLGQSASSRIVGPDGEIISESTMTGNDRRIAGALIAHAVENMAHGEFQTWWECLETLREMLHNSGWKYEQVMGLFREIEQEAITDSGDRMLGEIARTWLRQAKKDVIH